jgi:Protein of unknown function (DUF3486)
MSRSKVARLPREVREEIEIAWREGRFTLDSLLEFLNQQAPEIQSNIETAVSRSGLGRYLSKYNDTFYRLREAEQVAGACVGKLGENPRGEVGRLLTQVLSSLALTSLNQVQGETVSSKELFFLSTVIKNLASAEKTSIDRELKIRKEIVAKVEKKVEEARASGIDPVVLARAKELVRGTLDER